MAKLRRISLFLWILPAAFGMISAVSADAAEENLYSSHGKRDPFFPLVSQARRESAGLLGVQNVEDLEVQGVVYDPKNGSVVIVNGSVLREGEEMGSVKILKVTPEGAEFLVNGVEAFKPVYQEETREEKKGN